MPNTTTGLFQTLVAAANQASASLQFRNAFVDAIFWDYQPVAATPFTTLNVIVPTVNEGDVVDIGSGPIQPTDTNHGVVAIALDKHFSNSFVIKDWDQVRTPVVLQQKYLQPRLEALLRKINRTIAQQINTTNFGTSAGSYSLISGAGADVFARQDLADAWKNLAGAGVPIEATNDLTFLTTPVAYGNMLASTTFNQESIVGVPTAEAVQQRAVIEQQFGARVVYDQHLSAYNSGKEPGVLMHRYAIAAVTANMPPGGPGVDETSIMLRGQIPVRMQMQYSMRDQGWLIHMDCGWGLKVVRPEFASLVETA